MLQSGYFKDFKGGPKLLFWGDAEDMTILSRVLRASVNKSVPIGRDTFSTAIDGKTVLLEPVPRSMGAQTRDYGFAWQLDGKTARQFAERIDALENANAPGHVYLYCGVAGEVEVMVSCDQYPADLKP